VRTVDFFVISYLRTYYFKILNSQTYFVSINDVFVYPTIITSNVDRFERIIRTKQY